MRFLYCVVGGRRCQAAFDLMAPDCALRLLLGRTALILFMPELTIAPRSQESLPGRQRPPVLWDCRGDSRAEILDGKGQAAGWRGLAAPAKFWASRRDLRLAARHADAAIFVSAPLREQYVPQLRPDTPQIIAPNCADEDLFFYSPELRKQVRADFGIAPNELLFVYSGTVKHYQNIEAMFHWYAAHARNLYRRAGC